MECKNIFCIYNKNEKCIFKQVSLNQLGCCDQMRLLNNQQFDFNSATEKIRNLINFVNDKDISESFRKYITSKNNKKTS